MNSKHNVFFQIEKMKYFVIMFDSSFTKVLSTFLRVEVEVILFKLNLDVVLRTKTDNRFVSTVVQSLPRPLSQDQ